MNIFRFLGALGMCGTVGGDGASDHAHITQRCYSLFFCCTLSLYWNWQPAGCLVSRCLRGILWIGDEWMGISGADCCTIHWDCMFQRLFSIGRWPNVFAFHTAYSELINVAVSFLHSLPFNTLLHFSQLVLSWLRWNYYFKKIGCFFVFAAIEAHWVNKGKVGGVKGKLDNQSKNLKWCGRIQEGFLVLVTLVPPGEENNSQHATANWWGKKTHLLENFAE